MSRRWCRLQTDEWLFKRQNFPFWNSFFTEYTNSFCWELYFPKIIMFTKKHWFVYRKSLLLRNHILLCHTESSSCTAQVFLHEIVAVHRKFIVNEKSDGFLKDAFSFKKTIPWLTTQRFYLHKHVLLAYLLFKCHSCIKCHRFRKEDSSLWKPHKTYCVRGSRWIFKIFKIFNFHREFRKTLSFSMKHHCDYA